MILGNKAAPFDHPKNITIGKGRIIWAKRNDQDSEAWALPGGKWTTDVDEATAQAKLLDELSDQNSHEHA